MLTNSIKDFFVCCCHVDFLLPFPSSKIPVILSRLVSHCFTFLPRPLNSLNNTCLNDTPRTKASWRHPEISTSLFSPHFLLSQSAVCYTQLCETPGFCQIKTHWPFCFVLLPFAPTRSCYFQIMFFPKTFPLDELTQRNRQVSLVHLSIPQLVYQ